MELEQEDGVVRCKYFETAFLKGESRFPLEDDSFYSVTCISGKGTVEVDEQIMDVSPGGYFLCPGP